MGFMTEVSILNDRWHEIRENPQRFVEEIYEYSMTMGRSPDYLIGQTTVAQTHHADDLRVYFARGNSFFDAFPSKEFDMRRLNLHIEFLKQMKQYLRVAEKETITLMGLHENEEK